MWIIKLKTLYCHGSGNDKLRCSMKFNKTTIKIFQEQKRRFIRTCLSFCSLNGEIFHLKLLFGQLFFYLENIWSFFIWRLSQHCLSILLLGSFYILCLLLFCRMEKWRKLRASKGKAIFPVDKFWMLSRLKLNLSNHQLNSSFFILKFSICNWNYSILKKFSVL